MYDAIQLAPTVVAVVPWILGFFFVLGVVANVTDPVAERMRNRVE